MFEKQKTLVRTVPKILWKNSRKRQNQVGDEICFNQSLVSSYTYLSHEQILIY